MTHASDRRGFVMPLVLLLSVMVAVMLGLAIERNSTKGLNTSRQVRAYREHHAAKGMQEAISAWLTYQNARAINEVLGEGGHVFDLDMPDRSIIKVYLRDGQGTILSPTAAAATDSANASAIQRRLRILCQDQRIPWEDFERPLGPFEVSVNGADPIVLQAVIEHYLGIDDAAILVARLLDLRADKGKLERQDILAAASELDLDNQMRNTLLSVLTATPELWFVTVELYSGGASGSKLTARYGGLVPVRANRAQSSGAWEQPGVFLTWEDLGVQYDRNEGDRR